MPLRDVAETRGVESEPNSDSQERLSLLGLQTVLAVAVLLVGVGGRFLPEVGSIRRAMVWAWTQDYTVSDGWTALAAWADGQGGWREAIGRAYQGAGEESRRWVRSLTAHLDAESQTAPRTADTGGSPVANAQSRPATSPGSQSAPAPRFQTGPAGNPRTRTGPEHPPAAAPGPQAPPAASGKAAPGQLEGIGGAGESPPAVGESQGDSELITVNRPPQVPAEPAIRPVSGPIQVGYDWQSPAGGGEEVFHEGVDLPAAVGDPVQVMWSGVVHRIDEHPDLGKMVEVDHRDQVSTLYLPLQDVAVQVGDRMEAGDVVGHLAPPPDAGLCRSVMEAEGTAREMSELKRLCGRAELAEPHLHLEVHRNRVSVDPHPFLADRGGI